jgi:hypothetical protein
MTRKPPAKPRTRSARTTPAAPRRRRATPAAPVLAQAPPDKCFWVNYGPILKDLRDLRDALNGGMSDIQFAHHVGAGKNDFAAWVEQVLGDAACAAALRKARTPAAALRAVDARLRRAP